MVLATVEVFGKNGAAYVREFANAAASSRTPLRPMM
jgi:hypothetical protein